MQINLVNARAQRNRRWLAVIMGNLAMALAFALLSAPCWAQQQQPAPPPAGLPAQPEAEEAAPAPQLPPDFTPPRPIPAEMTLEKPLLTPEEVEEYNKSKLKRDFPKALLSGRMDSSTQQMIREGIKFRVYELTLKENWPNLHEMQTGFVQRELFQAGKLLPQGQAEFREFVMGEVTARAEELLDNNFYVRLRAVILLSSLNVTEEDRRNGIPPLAYTPAASVLLKVVKDAAQPEAVKLHAVKGLKRIAELGRPSDNFRVEIGDALIAQLANEKAHYWYQMRVTEALATMDVLRHPLNGTTFIVDALNKTLTDSKRHWVVRCQAAKSLGRVRLLPKNAGEPPANIHVGRMARQMADLARDMADAYNANPEAYYWKDCYLKLYLAFQPLDTAEKNSSAGLLLRTAQSQFGTHAPLAKESYNQVVLPLARHVLKATSPTPLTKAQLDPVDQWLDQNKAVLTTAQATPAN